MEIDTPAPEDPKAMSVSELIQECNEAVTKMSNSNPNKRLMFNCAFALRQLVDRLEVYENPEKVN